MPDSRLREVFKFTASDLRANRRGLLTESQIQRLQDEHRENTRFAWLLLPLAIVTIVAVTASLVVARTNDFIVPQPILMILTSIGFSALILWIIVRWHHHQLQRTIEAGVVEHCEGKLHVWQQDQKATVYYLQVGQQRFVISPSDFLALSLFSQQIGECRGILYFTPLARHILSIEIVSM